MKHKLLVQAHHEYDVARDLLSEVYPSGDFTEVANHLANAILLNLECYLVQCNFAVHTDKTLANYIACAKVCDYSELTMLTSMQDIFDRWLTKTQPILSYASIDRGFDIFAFSYN